MCDLEHLVNEEAIARVGLQRHVKKKVVVGVVVVFFARYLSYYLCFLLRYLFHCNRPSTVFLHATFPSQFLRAIGRNDVVRY
jgi:hypothetical protein